MARKRAATKTSKKPGTSARRATASKTAKAGSRSAGKAAGARAGSKTTSGTAGATKPVKPRAFGASERNLVVTVGDPHLANIHDVASQLRSRGMKVDSVLEATGMITGTYAREPSTLSGVKGVTSVEEQPRFQLPPPGSDIQ